MRWCRALPRRTPWRRQADRSSARLRHQLRVVAVERALVRLGHQDVARRAGEGRSVALARRRLAAESHLVDEPALTADVAAQCVLHALPDVAVVLLEDASGAERERILPADLGLQVRG